MGAAGLRVTPATKNVPHHGSPMGLPGARMSPTGSTVTRKNEKCRLRYRYGIVTLKSRTSAVKRTVSVTVTSVPTYDIGYDIAYGLVLYRQLNRTISAVARRIFVRSRDFVTISYDVAYDILRCRLRYRLRYIALYRRYIGVISRYIA